MNDTDADFPLALRALSCCDLLVGFTWDGKSTRANSMQVYRGGTKLLDLPWAAVQEIHARIVGAFNHNIEIEIATPPKLWSDGAWRAKFMQPVSTGQRLRPVRVVCHRIGDVPLDSGGEIARVFSAVPGDLIPMVEDPRLKPGEWYVALERRA